MTIKITGPKAIELLEAAVAERGADYVHNALCQYADPDTEQPLCLVGLAFRIGEVPIESLIAMDSTYDEEWTDHRGERHFLDPDIGNLYDSGFLSDELGIQLSYGAARALDAAQRAQDAKLTWGDALEAAKNA